MITVAVMTALLGAILPACGEMCGPDTYEKGGLCLPIENLVCVNGRCDANPQPKAVQPTPVIISVIALPEPVKQLVCGKGTHLANNECLPDNPSIEVCDGKDNNGDGQVDESDPNAGMICIKNRLLSKESTPRWGTLTCQDVSDETDGARKLVCAGNSICFAKETCGNGVDDNCDGQVDEGCQMANVNTVTVSASPYTPSARTFVMGWRDVELMQFTLTFNTQEDVSLETLTITDDTTSHGALQNLKLMNSNVAYSVQPSIFWQKNITTATFNNLIGEVKWVKGHYAITLNIKAYVTDWADGGQVSDHRLRVTQATFKTMSGAKITTSVSTGINEPVSNWMSVRRTLLSFALASDSPSGAFVAQAEQVVAKFAVNNSPNVGNYPAYLHSLALTIPDVNKTAIMKIYKNAVTAENLLAQTTLYPTGFIANMNLDQLTVPAGTSVNLIATLDTASLQLPATSTFRVELTEATWGDGVAEYEDWFHILAGPLTY
jgi:hypothetical protein